MNPLLPPSLLAMADQPSLPEVVEFQATGLVVVFCALGSIWFLMEIIGKLFRLREARTNAAAPQSAAAPPLAPDSVPTSAPAPASGDTPPEVVAAIAAAVQTTLGAGRCRIRSIKPVDPQLGWAAEGRRDIFSSHRVR